MLHLGVWSCGIDVNEGLLMILTQLIVQRSKGNSRAARLEWIKADKPELYMQVEAKNVSYLNSFLCFIQSEGLYVSRVLSHDTQQIETFHVHSSGKLSDMREAIAYAFIGVSNPVKRAWRPRQAIPTEAGLCIHNSSALMAPCLCWTCQTDPSRTVKLLQLQCTQDHIKDSY